jgi:arylsulfatase
VPGWPLVINLKADPYERMWQEGTMNYWRWYGDNMWTFVPAQEYIQQFLATIPKFPFQAGSSLNAAGVNYQSLQAQEVLKKLETMSLPRN